MDSIRYEALVQAVIARHQDESPEATVKRAEAFDEFLRPTRATQTQT